MSGTEEYGIQSIPPRYYENNSFYVHNSDGYNRAVENFDTEKRDIADAELKAVEQQRFKIDDNERFSEIKREDEKKFLESIRLKKKQVELHTTDISEYVPEEEFLSGTNVDLLA